MPIKSIIAALSVLLLTGCLADLGERDNIYDPNSVYNVYEKGYPWVEYNYDDLDRVRIVTRFRVQAKFFYLILPDGATAPTVDQVKSGDVAGKIASGTIAIAPDAATNETNVTIIGFATNLSYNAYFVSTVRDKITHGPIHQRINPRYLGWYGWDGALATWHNPVGTPANTTTAASDGRFNDGPMGIALDGIGYLYAADYGNHRVMKFTTNFTFVGWWGRGTISGWHYPSATNAAGSGSGDYQFNQLRQIAIDKANRWMYVADYANNRVQKYNLDTSLLMGWWGRDNLGDTGWHNPGSGRTGSSGGSDGQFNGPHGVAVDENGFVYVAEWNNHRVQVFRSVGASVTYVTKLGLTASAQGFDGFFNAPSSVYSDGMYLFVAEGGNHRIQRFLISTWESVWKWGGYGGGSTAALALFNTPRMMALDRHSHVYVADEGNYRVQKFSYTGRILWRGGCILIPPVTGTGDAQMSSVSGVAVDDGGTIYVGDRGNRRIHKYY